MDKFRKSAIKGIQTKILGLILLTVVLLSVGSTFINLRQSRMLADLSTESTRRQQEAIRETTSEVMDSVICRHLERANRSEARMMDRLFAAARKRIQYIRDYTEIILADPGQYPAGTVAELRMEQQDAYEMAAIYAEGTDKEDPALVSKLSVLGGMTDMLTSLCSSYGVSTVYFGLPEGVHVSFSNSSGDWFRDGELHSFDPRTRDWYTQAVTAGKLIFTEGDVDANTGAYCIECAAPIYGPDGELAAVVGTDIYLNEMQRYMENTAEEGEYPMLVGRDGTAVLDPQAEDFPMSVEDRTGDLRNSSTKLLADVVQQAMQGSNTEVLKGELEDGWYYITASSIPATGWVLVSAYSGEIAGESAALLEKRSQEIREEAGKLYRANTEKSRKAAVALILSIMFGILAVALILGRHIVKPLNTITKRISQYRGGNLEFKMEDAYRTGDEVEELARSFAEMSHQIVEYVETVKQATAEKERLGTELSLASQIQSSMLPHTFPAFPDRKEIDIFATMDPAREVGGDFYDFFFIDPDHLCMVIADVSGKGVPGALFMMSSKIILQSTAMLRESPAEILERTNEAICANNEADMFVTVWIGILEISTGRLKAANAGHEYPVIQHQGGAFELVKDKHGLVVGYTEDISYQEYELQMQPGDRLFVYTDGVPEATNDKEELFGTDRMVEALNARPVSSPKDVLGSVRAAVDAFVGEAEQFDDLTMLCMEYRGPEGTEGMKMTASACIASIPEVIAWTDGILESLECLPKAQSQIDVAIDEIFSNIAHYAYPEGEGSVQITLEHDEEANAVRLSFADQGTPFNPLEVEEPDVTLGAEGREIGGLGIFLVKKLMDEVHYERRDNSNILTLVKTIGAKKG